MTSSLIEALENDSSNALSLVRGMLDHGARIDERSAAKQGDTPLHVAARKHSPDMLKLLLDRGASIDARNGHEMTPLMSAISGGKTDNCKLLLERGADPKLRCIDGKGTLHLAVGEENLATLELLLNHGADINMVQQSGCSALSAAIMLDLRGPAGPASRGSDVQQDTPKHRIMQLLIERGTAIDKKAVDGATDLHTAAVMGDLAAVRILLDAGADPNAIDDCYRKPLWPAVRQNHIPIMELLLPLTTNIDDQIYTGHTYLSTAARWGHKECVRMLLDAGAAIWPQLPGPQFVEPERRCKHYGCDAMYWACDEDARDDGVVSMILEEGAKRSSVTDGTEQFAHWSGVWDRAVPAELAEFVKWINSRQAAGVSAEVEALRKEIIKRVYALEDEKRQKLAQEIALETRKGEEESAK